jgi:hypothetical protein
VRKYPSCQKVLREVKKIMKISLVNTNGKKRCTLPLLAHSRKLRITERFRNTTSTGMIIFAIHPSMRLSSGIVQPDLQVLTTQSQILGFGGRMENPPSPSLQHIWTDSLSNSTQLLCRGTRMWERHMLGKAADHCNNPSVNFLGCDF